MSWEGVRIRSWGLLEAVLGESWKRSWGVPSGVSWGVLRASWGRSSGLLGRLGDLLGESPGVSWGSWRGPQGVLEVLGSPDGSGDRPGGLIGGTLGRSGESWERFGSVLGGVLRGSRGSPGSVLDGGSRRASGEDPGNYRSSIATRRPPSRFNRIFHSTLDPFVQGLAKYLKQGNKCKTSH